MTHPLYSLRTDGDQYRITKFADGNVESTYLCTESECECPAGHRHTCRHRQMLPTMLAHKLTNTHWFFAFDSGGQIVDFNGTPKRLFDELAAIPGIQVVSLEDPATLHNTLADVFDEPHINQHTESVPTLPRAPWRRL